MPPVCVARGDQGVVFPPLASAALRMRTRAQGAEVMLLAAEAYAETADVLWRVIDVSSARDNPARESRSLHFAIFQRIAKYAATSYLEAIELGDRGVCEVIVKACTAWVSKDICVLGSFDIESDGATVGAELGVGATVGCDCD